MCEFSPVSVALMHPYVMRLTVPAAHPPVIAVPAAHPHVVTVPAAPPSHCKALSVTESPRGDGLLALRS